MEHKFLCRVVFHLVDAKEAVDGHWVVPIIVSIIDKQISLDLDNSFTDQKLNLVKGNFILWFLEGQLVHLVNKLISLFLVDFFLDLLSSFWKVFFLSFFWFIIGEDEGQIFLTKNEFPGCAHAEGLDLFLVNVRSIRVGLPVDSVKKPAQHFLQSLHFFNLSLHAVVALHQPSRVLSGVVEHVPDFTFVFVPEFEQKQIWGQGQEVLPLLLLLGVVRHVFNAQAGNTHGTPLTINLLDSEWNFGIYKYLVFILAISSLVGD